ncbi:UDP-3-O-(3-hydroxymyristoyl)glucosamine N-acyltransferase [Aestuariivita sp.]|jgi:UDP-3-O-[3-hydroxymyristoyl] glucosamine N-acyltransferase|uniref:UDP-3-O-(3-hydroxymyristoyl)glucosamine N-acyltransferase n=1 Tax=Aestuariivita sp. TaxID=1872407 RepID=UPI0021705FA9|nr:UDP-3-O-(3-hydroxymyristoyl)glucosamine N-acyltransferase [Aestuariivita sp.]MCE8007793.1 UDP-3-O-(3-hydroxymyristoyl)glucosamine N-acyltransferase [Aestuariivita sp.]
MPFTIAQIADAIGAKAEGDTALAVTAVAEPADARSDQLAMATNPKYTKDLSEGQAQAAVLWADADWRDLGLKAAILPQRPRFAMAGLTRMMDPGQGFGSGIHPSAVIDPTAQVHPDATVGPNTVIGPRATIAEGAVIGPLCFIGADVVLGPNAYLREHVSIGARVRIGANFIGQPGARIGGDGFSFVTPEPSGAEAVRETLGDQGATDAQSYARIHSLGAVRIGDDVEIGASTTIDNGTVRDTVIGAGTKIDNLTQIGHNVVIGRDCLICAQSGIAGSTTLGNNVVLGGQTGITDNIFVGDRVIAGGGSKVLTNIPAGRVVLGYPATKMDTQIEAYKALRRLPRLMRDVQTLQKAVFKPGSND